MSADVANPETQSEEEPAEPIAGGSEPPESNGRRKAFWRVFFILLAASILIVGAMAPVAIHATSTPDFCSSCHIMEPYYESWARSSHKDVTCVKCHLEPGLEGTIKGKWQALSQLTRYVTRTYGTRPWAEVGDGSCTQCHAKERLDEKLPRGKLKFVHAPHLDGTVRDKHLKCTTCHTQLDTSEHLAIDKTACYLCHFKPLAGGELPEIASCTKCHQLPDQPIEYQDTTVTHAQLSTKGVSCEHCHAGLAQGRGDVSRARCTWCHANVESTLAIADPQKVHDTHLAGKSVQCLRCHNEISHERRPVDVDRSRQNCTACHDARHEGPAELYSGKVNGHDMPSPMFTSRIECQACHDETRGGRPDEESCRRCHSDSIGRLLVAWKDQMEQGRQALAANLESIEKAAAATAASELESAFEPARLAGRVLSNGKGIHNIQLSRTLLLEADQALRQAVERTGAEVEMKELAVGRLSNPDDQDCVRCHFGIEQVPVPFEGKVFPHEVHVISNGASCSECHRSEPGAHGKFVASREEYCSMCHYEA